MHCNRPGQMSYDSSSYNLTAVAVGSSGRLGKIGGEFIDQRATSVVRRKDGENLRSKEAKKGQLIQIILFLSGRQIGCRIVWPLVYDVKFARAPAHFILMMVRAEVEVRQEQYRLCNAAKPVPSRRAC